MSFVGFRVVVVEGSGAQGFLLDPASLQVGLASARSRPWYHPPPLPLGLLVLCVSCGRARPRNNPTVVFVLLA